MIIFVSKFSENEEKSSNLYFPLYVVWETFYIIMINTTLI